MMIMMMVVMMECFPCWTGKTFLAEGDTRMHVFRKAASCALEAWEVRFFLLHMLCHG